MPMLKQQLESIAVEFLAFVRGKPQQTMLLSTGKLVAAMEVVFRLLLPAAFACPASNFLTNLSFCATPLLAANLGDIEPSLGLWGVVCPGRDPTNAIMVSRGVIFIYIHL